jgi:hypothetical protein
MLTFIFKRIPYVAFYLYLMTEQFLRLQQCKEVSFCTDLKMLLYKTNNSSIHIP